VVSSGRWVLLNKRITRASPVYAVTREHVEHLEDLGGHIRRQYCALLKDTAEAALRALESANWLNQGHARQKLGKENETNKKHKTKKEK